MSPDRENGYDESEKKSILDGKRYNLILIGAVGLFILVAYIISSVGSSVESGAIQAAKDRILANGGQALKEIKFYDIETQLHQREDKEIEQEGIMSVWGRFEYTEKGSDARQYKLFSTNVTFFDGSYHAGYVDFQTDYQRYER